MGWTTAHGLAESVTDHGVSLRQAVSFHLSSNFYPPLPGEYLEPVLAALEAVCNDDGALMIPLPVGTNPLPRTAEWIDGQPQVDADTLVSITRTFPFIEPEPY